MNFPQAITGCESHFRLEDILRVSRRYVRFTVRFLMRSLANFPPSHYSDVAYVIEYVAWVVPRRTTSGRIRAVG